jgi:Flp pilus assembly protein TadD
MSVSDDSSQTTGFVKNNVLKVVDENRNLQGTGFCLNVNKYKFIITCHHCIYKMEQIFVEKNDTLYSCNWDENLSDMNLDLAVLIPDDKTIPIQPLKHHLEALPYLPLFMWSFSILKYSNFPEGAPTEGATLSSEDTLFRWPEENSSKKNPWNNKPEVKVYVYQFLGPCEQGFSGAPVCYKENKKVIGIFTAKDDKYGYVIPIQTLLQRIANGDSVLAPQPTRNSMQLIENGNKYYYQGDFRNSIREYNQIIYDENYINALNNKGNALTGEGYKAINTTGDTVFADGKFKEALHCYDVALSIDPNAFNPLSNKGRVLCLLREFEKAELWLDKALKINPNDIMSLGQKGITLTASKRFKEAIPYYDKIININPDDVQAHFNKGEASRMIKDYEQALLSFNEVLRIRPKDIDSLVAKGYTYYYMGKREEAIRLFDEVLRLHPSEGNKSLAIKGKNLCKY